jgi:hypothetical protein
MRYSLEELRLLSFVVRSFDSGQYSIASDDDEASDGYRSDGSTTPPTYKHIKNGAYCITLTETQISAIEKLNAYLAGSTYNSKELFSGIDDLVEALYMPTNSDEMLSNIFISPVVAFMCIRALAAKGGFRPPKLITGPMVALQCDIRLCIFFVVMRRWRQRKETGQLEADGDWFQ